MASPNQVKQYLAYWFQLGKPLVAGDRTILPQPVMQGNSYSAEFEDCWQTIEKAGGRNCYLQGTLQSVDELLSSRWEITSCVRCDMPVPTMSLGIQPAECPCIDLPSWPNLELPKPRPPVDTHAQLNQIRDRLLNSKHRSEVSSRTQHAE